tara:strand:- start:814 stop:1044 length:231 start_codon:yes stop_codon:yes gene_type:complete
MIELKVEKEERQDKDQQQQQLPSSALLKYAADADAGQCRLFGSHDHTFHFGGDSLTFCCGSLSLVPNYFHCFVINK